jgi:hypothetical protein
MRPFPRVPLSPLPPPAPASASPRAPRSYGKDGLWLKVQPLCEKVYRHPAPSPIPRHPSPSPPSPLPSDFGVRVSIRSRPRYRGGRRQVQGRRYGVAARGRPLLHLFHVSRSDPPNPAHYISFSCLLFADQSLRTILSRLPLSPHSGADGDWPGVWGAGRQHLRGRYLIKICRPLEL